MKTLLLGDVCPSNVTRDAFQRKETGKLFGDFIEVMRSSDFTFVNLECAITDSEAKIKKFGPHLKAPRETAEVLRELGVAVCGLSNNHVFDFGTEGAVDTIKALSSVGIEYTGFGDNYEDARKNYVFEKDGEKIATFTVVPNMWSTGMGYIHMVACRAEYRGMGIGKFIADCSLQKLIDMGKEKIFLLTGEARHAALRTYIGAGFLPVNYIDDEGKDMIARWQSVVNALKLESLVLLDDDGKPMMTLHCEG